MRRIFIFNGDADGLCALQQLLLAEGGEGCLFITGPKRKTELVKEADALAGDELTVLDVSLAVNREAVEQALRAGARVRYFDHHHAGRLPAHPAFEGHIAEAPDVCTSILVDRHLDGAHRTWAVVGAFGDNLQPIARRLGSELRLSQPQLDLLEKLGIALNYNSYGETEKDLFFPPLALHRRMAPHVDPFSFMEAGGAFSVLWDGYLLDLEKAAALSATSASEHAALYVLPAEAWARRVSGVLANRLARGAPERAHAVLVGNSHGGVSVSVRAPLARPIGAARLCLGFAGGGGREAAAGINDLGMSQVELFTRRFMDHFRR